MGPLEGFEATRTGRFGEAADRGSCRRLGTRRKCRRAPPDTSPHHLFLTQDFCDLVLYVRVGFGWCMHGDLPICSTL